MMVLWRKEVIFPRSRALAAVSTRSRANKTGTQTRPRHIPYSRACMVKPVWLILPHTALADLSEMDSTRNSSMNLEPIKGI